MGFGTTTSDFNIECKVDGNVVAEFSGLNGIEGNVFEADVPRLRMHSSQLLDIAKFLSTAPKSVPMKSLERRRNPMTPSKTWTQKAKEYSEYCDNESGSFLTGQLEKIREKAYIRGVTDLMQDVAPLVEAIDHVLKKCPHMVSQNEAADMSIEFQNLLREALAKFNQAQEYK